ncbi:hypothetical protein Snoj_25810 [Streptomyces nojiriensis]|uniref:Uncharacterized protein n=1 Tax=Streptomyces nojiriensis TaxID=66374 RepID=A0ABQ3SKJ6_9ACTN|nr:helicase [Streptomyces nojiriensis]GHI68663.1 hypothetical protein Snoj_25810 [Streptomyces nojiriensis]
MGGVLGRGVVKQLPDSTEHRTGIRRANQKAHRDQLHPDQLRALAKAGIDWAQ